MKINQHHINASATSDSLFLSPEVKECIAVYLHVLYCLNMTWGLDSLQDQLSMTDVLMR